MDGKFIEGNQAFSALVGRPREEMLTMNYQSLTLPEHRARHADAVEHVVKTGQQAAYMKEYLKQDGSRIKVSVGLFLVRGSGEAPVGLGSIIKPAATGEVGT